LVRSVKQYGLAFRTKHMQVWSSEPDEQALIERLGWDGGLRVNPGDYLYIVDNKIIPNKVDYYTHSRIDYAVSVQDSGTVRSTCTVTLDNRTPEGLPGSIRGSPHHGIGLNRALISLYAPEGARATSLSPAAGLPSHVERDARVFVRTLEAPLGGTAAARYVYTVPRAIMQVGQDRVYQLTVQHQPLVNPAELFVTVTFPKGTQIKSFGPGWRAIGNVATLHVTMTRDLVTRIVF
jgi:hypothetical protein